MSENETEPTNPQEAVTSQRLLSLDAYRGLIMISLAFVGFGLAGTADNFLESNPDATAWQGIKYQFSHAQWVGCSYWDMIQPSFMFMVGVSMAYSYAKRRKSGHSYKQMFFHALTRAIVLVLLSVFLMSMWGDRTNWQFMNVLAQIGLAYTFLFLFWERTIHVQALGAVALLAMTWLGYFLYPGAGVDIQKGAPEVGVSLEWAQEHLTGIAAAWHKNANLGHQIDLWLLNLFPRSEPFTFNKGGYQTINFVPSLATMLFGLMCGELLRSSRSNAGKLALLIIGGLVGLLAGFALDYYSLCPIIKRIWTPSWTLFSTGWCCLILATLYGVIDILKYRRWAFPLVVVGMNSIAMYCMSMTLKPWVARQLRIHFGEDLFTLYGLVGSSVVPSVQAILVGLILWLICYYLYRNKMFLRI